MTGAIPRLAELSGSRTREIGWAEPPRFGDYRVVATARVVVAVLPLIAAWIDPLLPATRFRLAVAVFSIYLAIAVGVLLLALWDELLLGPRLRIALHVLDLVFVSLVAYLTAATIRAFFPGFLYVLMVAHLLWGWRGTLWTAAAAMTAIVAIEESADVYSLGRTGLDDAFVRLAYIAIVAGLLAYLGRAQQEASARMRTATDWPGLGAPEAALPVYLARAAQALDATRVLLIWLGDSEPAAELAFWLDGNLRSKKRDRDLVETWCDPGAARVDYWRARSGAAHVITASGRRVVARPPFPRRLLRAGGAQGVFRIPFVARAGHGCLLVWCAPPTADGFDLAELIASRFVAWANESELARERDAARLRQQRFELAGELHDGVVQTLAGAGLQLQSVRRLVGRGDPAASERLDELIAALAAEQSRLRRRLRRLVPEPPPALPPIDLGERLGQLAGSIERSWGPSIDWQVEPPHARVTPYVGEQLSRLVLEAAANAAKHSKATRLSVRVTVEPADILLSVANDRPAALEARPAVAFEPKMLRARLDHLGGTLRVKSDRDRVVVDMAFPMPEPAHA